MDGQPTTKEFPLWGSLPPHTEPYQLIAQLRIAQQMLDFFRLRLFHRGHRPLIRRRAAIIV